MAGRCGTNDGHLGIPAPAVLKLSADKNVPLHDVVVMAGKVETRIEVPTLRSFVLVSENDMPDPLRAWFDAHKAQWARVDADALKHGGPQVAGAVLGPTAVRGRRP